MCGRASGMRMCDSDSASGSARRAGVRTYFLIIIIVFYYLIRMERFISHKRRHGSRGRRTASAIIAPRAQEASEAKRAQRARGGRLSGKRECVISGGQCRVQYEWRCSFLYYGELVIAYGQNLARAIARFCYQFMHRQLQHRSRSRDLQRRPKAEGRRGARTAIPPAVRKQCGSSAEAVRKQCEKAAEAVRR